MKSVKQTSRSRLCLDYIQSLPFFKTILTIAILIPLSLNVTQGKQFFQKIGKTDRYKQVVNNDQLIKSNNTQVLTIVTVENSTTLFNQDGFAYGFGYDLIRNFSDQMNLRLDVKTVANEATALKWVKQGKAQIALSTAPINQVEDFGLIAVESSCGIPNTLQKYGLDPNLSLVFQSAEKTLTASASGYLCQAQQSGAIQQLASFYDQNYLNDHDLDVVTRNLENRLPIYKANFKQSAQAHDLDWQFLAAIGYQESYLNPNSISPTGVRGVMMLTQNTARAMGVSDRTNPAQSIQGGAKYIDAMLEQYDDVPQPDRNWYALVAYNMGPGALNQIMAQLQRQGKNPNQWVNVYRYLQEHQHRNNRYSQALQYVKRIRVYLEHIKTSSLANV
ncbi:transglycosylase SLT domain-containing protein [Acinetobacter qingfengensis]|uniref:ABC transporter substrate-binding protein n=1 Tax=Acinetobacter qingfengensis TaxID=1262585 RepID=A0A1E7REN8_9GAMM|nr:transglycosylase SLT domain-containing protein [Acinetobacter qingfengensis]KAA8731122.1 transglycosylase SLT domain-containing protein [Acinetobacter qingfengensis]OEY97791.1 ABC transporter substrate-binding protein [Acinetobacter qingfengensis]